jgi:hypothetical protein|eukprot:COSAG02_NODE_3343_length_6898_cov_9.593617_7_plen_84_part_00
MLLEVGQVAIWAWPEACASIHWPRCTVVVACNRRTAASLYGVIYNCRGAATRLRKLERRTVHRLGIPLAEVAARDVILTEWSE